MWNSEEERNVNKNITNPSGISLPHSREVLRKVMTEGNSVETKK